MLEVMPQAQAAGQKAQQDAQMGQGSIFDGLDDGGGDQPGAGAKTRLPVPALPDERQDLNAMEKETLGLFLSSHPLKEVRAALRAAVECPLADLNDKKDGEWVTVGGMIAECKKIKTRKGDDMMFATLDDLEGQVEMLIFNSAFEKNAGKVDLDAVLLVRGRVDHKEAGETKLVVQEVTPFEPTPEEVAQAEEDAAMAPIMRRISLTLDPGASASVLDDLMDVVRGAPGDHELLLLIGERRLVLGETFRVSPACRTELAELSGVSLAA
jgi:DNA polymerase-3 subunit alpha